MWSDLSAFRPLLDLAQSGRFFVVVLSVRTDFELLDQDDREVSTLR